MKLKSFLKYSFYSVLTLGTLGASTALGLYSYFSADLPDVKSLKDPTFNQQLKIYDSTGLLLADYGIERREALQPDQFPRLLKDAIISIEDRRFYEHDGYDLRGIARAVYVLATTGVKSQGASTITQQVARNFYLNNRKEFIRKIKEVAISIKLEQEFSKEEILALYMNKIFLGNRSYGFKSASKTYFNVEDLNDLSLSQAATLAGIQKSPSQVNPIASITRATARRNQVLKAMYETGKISKEDYDKTIAEKIEVVPQESSKFDYITEVARSALYEKFGEEAYTSGYNVKLTVDLRSNIQATASVRRSLLAYEYRHGWRGVEHNLLKERKLTSLNDIKAVLKQLNKFPEYSPLIPMVVLETSKTEAKIVSSGENYYTLGLKGVSWAGEYKGVSKNGNYSKGPAPTDMSKLLKVGDVIYVTLDTDSNFNVIPKLAQIPEINSGLVSLNSRTGAIVNMVGGFSYDLSVFNRAVQSSVQVGSTIKPFAYAFALENGYTWGTQVDDKKLRIMIRRGDYWEPKNYGDRYKGEMTLRQGMSESRNSVIIQVVRDIGVTKFANYLTHFGFSKNSYVATNSLVLGTANFTPLEMARAYATFSNGGFLIDPYIIEEVTDAAGNLVFKAHPRVACDITKPENRCDDIPSMFDDPYAKSDALNTHRLTSFETEEERQARINRQNLDVDTSEVESAEQKRNLKLEGLFAAADDSNNVTEYAPRVLSPEVAWLMHDGLHTNIFAPAKSGFFPTGASAKKLGRNDIGGKTGTTNDSRATWFIGYAGPYTTAVYLAFDDNRELGRGEAGGTTALPGWIDFTRNQLRGIPEVKYPYPTNVTIVRTQINNKSGKLDANGYTEYFVKGTEPKEVHVYQSTTGNGGGDSDLSDLLDQ